MDIDSKRQLIAVPNEASAPSCRVFSCEDQAWRNYVENPLTAATKAMMSINGDEDGAATLGLLYDYYKHCQAPKESKSTTAFKPMDYSAMELKKRASQDILNQYVQALTTMPVNLSSSYSAIGRHGAESEAKMVSGGGGLPLSLTRAQGQASMLDCGTSGCYREDPREEKRLLYEQSCYDMSAPGCLKNEQRSSREESVKKEVYHRSACAGIDSSQSILSASRFQYSLDASMSLRPRQEDGPMIYLNRGQFYALTLSDLGFRSSLRPPEDGAQGGGAAASPSGKMSGGQQFADGSEPSGDGVVQSVVMVVFGEDKGKEEQLKNWKYWHSRQPTAKQRVLDIADYKESISTIGNIEEIAYNAVSFTWDVSEEAKVFISVNSLSTDFSSQKGVKGMPLIIQIDTYSYNGGSGRPIHRAFSQIKVFCDKGAERKLRDEEKKQLKKQPKAVSPESTGAVKKFDCASFQSMLDLDSQPVLFIPDVYFENLQRAGQVVSFHAADMNRNGGVVMKRVLSVPEENVSQPQHKKFKREAERKVLLYVRKESDEVFDALMLHSPTLGALTEAISEKYAVPLSQMTKVYRKSKKGVLVNVDDNVVQHLSNEDTFILALESSAESMRVLLSEI